MILTKARRLRLFEQFKNFVTHWLPRDSLVDFVEHHAVLTSRTRLGDTALWDMEDHGEDLGISLRELDEMFERLTVSDEAGIMGDGKVWPFNRVPRAMHLVRQLLVFAGQDLLHDWHGAELLDAMGGQASGISIGGGWSLDDWGENRHAMVRTIETARFCADDIVVLVVPEELPLDQVEEVLLLDKLGYIVVETEANG